jgi:MFS family permease
MALMTVIFGPVSGRIVGHRGPRLALVMAGPAMAVGTGLLTTLGAHTAVAYLLCAYVLFGVGFGLVNTPISNTAVSGMPREQAGVAGAVASTSRQIGAALGVAVTGSLIAGSPSFVDASHAAWVVLTGCGVAILLLGVASTGRWALGTAERTRVLLETETREASDGALERVG